MVPQGPEQCVNRALLCAPATTARLPIVVEEAAKEVLSEAVPSLITPQEISPVPNLPSLAELNLPGQVSPAAVPAGPSLSLKVPPSLPSPSLSSSPDPPPDPALIEIPPDFEFDRGSFAPYNHYAGMQCTIPPTKSHMSLLDEMAAPLHCYSQGVAMPVATFLHAPISQPVVHQPPILQPVVHQPTPSVAPPILQPVTPALALINPTTDVPTTNGINVPGDSEATTLSMDAISTDFTLKPTNPPRHKHPRDDGINPSFIVTTKCARKPQERTEIDTITKPLAKVKDKENWYGSSLCIG